MVTTRRSKNRRKSVDTKNEGEQPQQEKEDVVVQEESQEAVSSKGSKFVCVNCMSPAESLYTVYRYLFNLISTV